MKTDEAIFRAMASDGKLLFFYPEDARRFCVENSGTEFVVAVKPAAKTSEKQKMYNYYYGPLLTAAINGYTHAGYEGVDKVSADYMLRANFAKGFIKKRDGTFEPYILSMSGMAKARLLKLVQDSLFFLESELHQQVPDSEEYKLMKLTGRKLKRITTEK